MFNVGRKYNFEKLVNNYKISWKVISNEIGNLWLKNENNSNDINNKGNFDITW